MDLPKRMSDGGSFATSAIPLSDKDATNLSKSGLTNMLIAF